MPVGRPALPDHKNNVADLLQNRFFFFLFPRPTIVVIVEKKNRPHSSGPAVVVTSARSKIPRSFPFIFSYNIRVTENIVNTTEHGIQNNGRSVCSNEPYGDTVKKKNK